MRKVSKIPLIIALSLLIIGLSGCTQKNIDLDVKQVQEYIITTERFVIAGYGNDAEVELAKQVKSKLESYSICRNKTITAVLDGGYKYTCSTPKGTISNENIFTSVLDKKNNIYIVEIKIYKDYFIENDIYNEKEYRLLGISL